MKNNHVEDPANSILSWIETNAERFDIRFEKFKWPLMFGIGHYDFACKIVVNGTSYEGRGSDTNENLSLCKAFVEAIERATVCEFSDLSSSNGVAAHLNSNQAARSAYWELIERDAFMCHFLSGRSFGKKLWSNSIQLNSFIEKGVEFEIREMAGIGDAYSVVCVSFGARCSHGWGMVVSCASDSSLDVAINKSIIENLRVVSDLILAPNKWISLTVENFNQLNDPKILDHFKLGLNFDYAKWFREKFLDSELMIASRDQISQVEFKYTPLVTNEYFGSDFPVKVLSCHSNRLQDLYFGKTDEGKVNMKRIKDFSKEITSYEDLVLCPHPFR